jgi:hypothetical protein
MTMNKCAMCRTRPISKGPFCEKCSLELRVAKTWLKFERSWKRKQKQLTLAN